MPFTAKQLALHVSRALERNKEAVLAYWWPQPWTDGDRLEVNGASVSVERCESVLEVRERLARDADRAKVLLIAVPEVELGQDVLARVYGRRLLHVDRWQMVEETFGTRQIDARVYAHPWMADALLEVPADRIAGGATALTYERALELCVGAVLGCSGETLELDDLLLACERAAGNWEALPAERKDLYVGFLRARFGPIAAAMLGAMSAGNGYAVVPIGLACEVLYGERARGTPDLRDSRVRLEAYLDGNRISESEGLQWSQASERVLRSRPQAERHAALQGAADLLRTLGAAAYIGESGVLPGAFDLRLEHLGLAVQAFLKKPDRLAAVEQAAAWVRVHRLDPPDQPALGAVDMALALCRREAGTTTLPSNLVSDYLQHGAWEDYARRVLRGVRPDGFARAVAALLERVAQRRATADRTFAEQLAESLRMSSIPSGVLPVEQALDRLIVPLAQETPVALLVLDGMSWDVYFGIAESLERLGWEQRSFEQAPQSLLATVPSVTECSRASLLCGRLARGTSAVEKPSFCAHPGLTRASHARRPPVLLHKAEVVTGNQLSDEAAHLLADPEQRVLGIVLNAVDDALAKSDQVRVDWSVEAIPLLGAILTQARLASRAVFITSDHGHVLEMGSQYRAASGSERWRTTETAAVEGEIRVGGHRVQTLIAGDVVVPWSEAVRYAAKKNGYHGGISRQEMLVPFGLWMPTSAVAPMYPVSVLKPPDWWQKAPADSRAASAAQTAIGTGERQADFFTAPMETSWIEDLVSSAILVRQRRRVGRIALDDDRLARLLRCLDRQGGRATTQQLAVAIEQPALRIRGVLSTLQRMLNVDGYPVVTIEAATGTVILNRDLLRKQFEL